MRLQTWYCGIGYSQGLVHGFVAIDRQLWTGDKWHAEIVGFLFVNRTRRASNDQLIDSRCSGLVRECIMVKVNGAVDGDCGDVGVVVAQKVVEAKA